MSKILKTLILFSIISFSMISLLPIHAEEVKEETQETDSFDAYIATGTGLVAVSGVGAAIIAHNNKKPKNEPKNKD